MYLNIFEKIGESLVKFFTDIKEFFIAYSRNPFLWIGIILLGLLIFELVYQALNKE